MVGFSGILGTGEVEDKKVMKFKLIDGKKLWVDLGVNSWRWLEMLVVNLMKNRIRQIRRNLLHWGYELTEKHFLMSWQINV